MHGFLAVGEMDICSDYRGAVRELLQLESGFTVANRLHAEVGRPRVIEVISHGLYPRHDGCPCDDNDLDLVVDTAVAFLARLVWAQEAGMQQRDVLQGHRFRWIRARYSLCLLGELSQGEECELQRAALLSARHDLGHERLDLWPEDDQAQYEHQRPGQ